MSVTQASPCSLEAEEAVIGALLVNGTAYPSLAAFLKPDDFYIVRNRHVWEAFDRLHRRAEPVDYLTVGEELKKMGHMADVGGMVYLTQLVNNTPDSTHAEIYGRIVERAAVRRRLLAAADAIKALAVDENTALEDIIEKSSKTFFEAAQVASGDQVTTFHQRVSECFDRVEKLVSQPEKLIGLPTGLTNLDELLQGLQKTDLIQVGGRPGMGKSSLLLTCILNILKADPKKIVALFSLEMSAEQLVQRAVSFAGGLTLRDLRAGTLGAQGWSRFVQATGAISPYNLFIDDRPGLTPMQMHSRLRKLTMGYGKPDLIVVDYIQLMNGGRRFKSSETRTQELGHISRSLKQIAKEFNAPVLCAAQLSRAVEQRQDKRPVLSDLRESGDLESDADIVMFIYRDEVYNEETEFPNRADIIVAKHRNGPTGTVSLYFEKALTRFANAAFRTVNLDSLEMKPKEGVL